MTGTSGDRQGPTLAVIETPDMAEVARRLMDLRDAGRVAEERIVIGGLCAEFTNDEIRLLADDYLNIGEVLTLRRLGLLAEDEGFDGSKASRNRCRHPGADQ